MLVTLVPGLPRVVRCGTHGLKHNNNELLKRLSNQHYRGDSYNSRNTYTLGGRSVYRKNIGKAFLENPIMYLSDTATPEQYAAYKKVWALSSIDKSKIIKDILKVGVSHQNYFMFTVERNLQHAISAYLEKNTSFSLVEVNTPEERAYFEKLIIATLSGSQRVRPSDNWLGYNSPVDKVRQSGLWQFDGVFAADCLNEVSFNQIVALLELTIARNS